MSAPPPSTNPTMTTNEDSNIFTPFLDHHLQHLLSPIDIPSLSRLPQTRLLTTALPHIGLIELVSASTFAADYDSLYVASFPKRTEREGSDLIVTRLKAQFGGERGGLAPYRIVGLRAKVEATPPSTTTPTASAPTNAADGARPDKDEGEGKGEVIGAAQFSVLLFPDGIHAVPYLQYIYISPRYRRKDMAEVLHTLVLAVAEADGGAKRRVPFTLFETEPPGHGDDEGSRENARQRAGIHARQGGVALVLRRGGADAKVLSAHVQPGLEDGDGPLTLVWVVRPSPRTKTKSEANEDEFGIAGMGSALIKAYYQSLRDEGFPEKNISVAEKIVAERERGSVFCLMPLEEVLPFTGEDGGVE